MRFFIFLFLALTAYVTALPTDNGSASIQPRFVALVGDDEELHEIDLEEEPDYDLIEEIENNPDSTRYYLFTRRNPTESVQLLPNDANSILESTFNPNVPTVVVSHGWLGSQSANLNSEIRDAFLDKDDVNIIILDWRRLALSGYVTAASGVPTVGRRVGQFLLFLNRVTGAPFETMHLVGFSLGAHLVGNAGREIGGRAARVTGLDPAGPLWTFSSNKISDQDARYVEIIHTDSGLTGLGLGSHVGHVDFFPNGGTSMSGCLTSICNHNRAWKYFASTVTNNHLIGRRCSNLIQLNLNLCRGDRLPMGNDDLLKTGSGMYRVSTRWFYPY